MKRIYLDQNKWIDLAAAQSGVRKGKAFQDALILLKAGVEAGELSVPLSSAHYLETNVRRDWRSRRDLALTMVAVSQLQTIAPIQAVIPPEIDQALERMTKWPVARRPLKPFGFGASHAFAHEIPRYRLPESLVWRVADRWGLEGDINRLREIVLLAGPTPAEEAEMNDFEPLAHLAVGEQYAKDKEELRQRRKAGGWNKGERAHRLANAQALADHMDVITEALARSGLNSDVLSAGGEARLTEFIRSVPTMWASSELERLRHTASERKWERQDLLDITALAVAGVYCDVVVTERQWVDAANRARLPTTLGTTFLASMQNLPAYLV